MIRLSVEPFVCTSNTYITRPIFPIVASQIASTFEPDATFISVFDVNQDGIVGPVDVMLVSPVGDGDLDGDVDLADYAVWQLCHGASGAPLSPPCALADLDSDRDVDLPDFLWFSNALSGPLAP